MSIQKENTPDEFDKLVFQYNDWLESLNRPFYRIKSLCKSILTELRYIINPSNKEDNSSAMSLNPLYNNRRLTETQKEAVVIASKWQRSQEDLESILNNGFFDKYINSSSAEAGERIATQMYNRYKNIYFAYVKS